MLTGLSFRLFLPFSFASYGVLPLFHRPFGYGISSSFCMIEGLGVEGPSKSKDITPCTNSTLLASPTDS